MVTFSETIFILFFCLRMSKLPMDPKVAAIMAKLQQGEKKREDVKVKEPEEPKPPKNLEEFIKFENLVCSLEI